MSKGNKPIDKVSDESKFADVADTLGSKTVKADTSVEANNEVATPGADRFNPTRIEGKGSSVKQEKIAEAISGNGAASGGGFASMSVNSGLRSIPYSGTDARIIDNASGTPAFDKSDRRDSRYGQKTDNTARHLNYVPSETYIIEQDGPTPLSESADKVQGGLGHPANEFALIQKASEAFPGTLNFERSVDEYVDDIILATTGQQLDYDQVEGGFADIDPTQTFDQASQTAKEYHLTRGNFIPHVMHVHYDSNGKLTDYYYDESRSIAHAKGDLVAERANTNKVTAANRAEIDRQAMAAKAGNEVEDTWSPIPFAYPEPTRDVLYLSTIEKQLGANTFVPVKMAAKAHSYQVSKAAKDGMRPEAAGAEICLGHVFAKSRSDVYDAFDFGPASANTSVFNLQYTSKGAPSGIIAMNDSVAKYHDRADVLTQPRSFNMILKNGLNNYKPFKIDPIFVHAFDNVNVFSTIDKPYDPSTPVCILDSIKLMNAYSFNELGSCFRTATVTMGYESDVGASKTALYKAADGTYINQMDSTTIKSTYYVVGALHRSLADGDIDDYTVTDDDIQEAFELIRTKAAGRMHHRLLHVNYAVPVMKTAASDASISAKCQILFFNFSDAPITANKKTFDIHYLSGTTDTKVSVSLNGNNGSTSDWGSTWTTKATDLVYNNYLAAWYHNRQNWYFIQLRDPYTDGIKSWLRMNYGLMTKVLSSGSYECPVVYSTKYFSAYSYIVMMALKYMQEQRAKGMLDVLNYANNFGYPFSDTEGLDGYSALGGKQYGQGDIFNQLEVRQMTPDAAIRWLYPEVFTNFKEATGAASGTYRVLHPWYMNEENFTFSDSAMALSYDRAAMSYPVTRAGVRWAYSDDLYGFEERDLRLLLDQMVIPPAFAGADSASVVGQVYKYSQSNDGLIVIPGAITMADALRTPRELGYVFPAAAGFVAPKANNDNNTISSNTTLTVATINPELAALSGHPAFRVVCWVNKDATVASNILDGGSSVIRRAASFAQKYYIFACDDANAGSDIGLPLSTASLLSSGAAVNGISSFIPFTNGIFTAGKQTQSSDSANSLFTYASVLFARMQKLPAAFNPFDFAGDGIECDPFSFNYIFGLVGFRASDYKEDLYNRLTRRMAEGWKYVSDPFIEGSLLTR